MALDGTVISCMAWELNHALAGGKINKIAQPEKDSAVIPEYELLQIQTGNGFV